MGPCLRGYGTRAGARVQVLDSHGPPPPHTHTHANTRPSCQAGAHLGVPCLRSPLSHKHCVSNGAHGAVQEQKQHQKDEVSVQHPFDGAVLGGTTALLLHPYLRQRTAYQSRAMGHGGTKAVGNMKEGGVGRGFGESHKEESSSAEEHTFAPGNEREAQAK
jgi:hypothetical protein